MPGYGGMTGFEPAAASSPTKYPAIGGTTSWKPSRTKIKKDRWKKQESFEISRDDKIRTCDPQTPSLVRYRTALRPEHLYSEEYLLSDKSKAF